MKEVIDVIKKYGETHIIQIVQGTNVCLPELKDNESVCYGDGITFHFLLIEK